MAEDKEGLVIKHVRPITQAALFFILTGITSDTFADWIGVHPNTVRNIIAGKPVSLEVATKVQIATAGWLRIGTLIARKPKSHQVWRITEAPSPMLSEVRANEVDRISGPSKPQPAEIPDVPFTAQNLPDDFFAI